MQICFSQMPIDHVSGNADTGGNLLRCQTAEATGEEDSPALQGHLHDCLAQNVQPVVPVYQPIDIGRFLRNQKRCVVDVSKQSVFEPFPTKPVDAEIDTRTYQKRLDDRGIFRKPWFTRQAQIDIMDDLVGGRWAMPSQLHRPAKLVVIICNGGVDQRAGAGLTQHEVGFQMD